MVHWNFQAYTKEHPKLGTGPPYSNPLLNFIWFLLLSIQASPINLYSSCFNLFLFFPDQSEPFRLLHTLRKIQACYWEGSPVSGVFGQNWPGNSYSTLDVLKYCLQHFFGVPAPVKPKPGGMFSGLFDQLLSAMNDEDEEEQESSAAAAGPSTSTSGSRASPKKTLATEDLD